MENSTYINECTHRKELVRWEDDSMPLRVFIDKVVTGITHDAEVYFVRQIKKALAEWEKASEGKISAKIVKEKTNADIIVKWVWKYKLLYKFDKSIGKCWMGKRLFEPIMRKTTIKICLPPDRPIQDISEFYPVILHEFGHAFGIYGHSPNKNDIMYKTLSSDNKTLSTQDKNTINLLYSLPPGANNQDIEASNTTKEMQITL